MALAREQITLGANTYGDQTADPVSGLERSILPDMARTIIQHEVVGSTVWPQRDLGPIPAVIRGTILLYQDDVHDFMQDVEDESAERELHWVDSGVEVYAFVRSGQCTRELWGQGLSAEFQWVTFEFTATRTQVYRNSDDAVMWGG